MPILRGVSESPGQQQAVERRTPTAGGDSRPQSSTGYFDPDYLPLEGEIDEDADDDFTLNGIFSQMLQEMARKESGTDSRSVDPSTLLPTPAPIYRPPPPLPDGIDSNPDIDWPDAVQGDEALDLVNEIVGRYMGYREPPAPEEVEGGELGVEGAAGTVSYDLPEGGEAGIRLVQIAQQYLGTPYVWGGTDPNRGVDCSGLLQAVARQMGISLPRVSRDQARAGVAVSLSEAGPGDLIAFDAGGPRGVVNHIGMIVGRDSNGTLKMIHAPYTGSHVQIASVNRTDIMAVRRITGGA